MCTKDNCLSCVFWGRLPDDGYVGWCQLHGHWRLQLEHCEHYVEGEIRKRCHTQSGYEPENKPEAVQLEMEMK